MNSLRTFLRNKTVRSILVVLIILLTFGIFTYYLFTHKEVVDSIAGLSPVALLLLTLAYASTIVINAFILWVSLRTLNKHVPFLENLALTGYSSIINFFGPLQSGPGFRAAYLKKRHSVGFKAFFYVTLVFYGFFGIINAFIIVMAFIVQQSNTLLTVAVLLATAIMGIIAYFALSRSSKLAVYIKTLNAMNLNFWLIGAGAVALSAATAVAYFIELHNVNPDITIVQTIIYAAAANLALFVSLTPGAIGFRESFLVLSQQLHGIAVSDVIAASIIDRAFYVVFLLALFVVLLLFGSRSRFRQAKTVEHEF